MSQELDWKKSAQMMDAAWDRFCVKVSHTFHKPEFDFLKRLLKGVMIQKDVIISKCAKVCRKEGTSIGTFSNIATKHLNKPTFEQRAQQALLQMMAPTVQKDTLIIADESDLAKPYAHYFETEEERGSSRAMEYVDRIRDGSTGEITNGYTLFLASLKQGVSSQEGSRHLRLADAIRNGAEAKPIKEEEDGKANVSRGHLLLEGTQERDHEDQATKDGERRAIEMIAQDQQDREKDIKRNQSEETDIIPWVLAQITVLKGWEDVHAKPNNGGLGEERDRQRRPTKDAPRRSMAVHRDGIGQDHPGAPALRCPRIGIEHEIYVLHEEVITDGAALLVNLPQDVVIVNPHAKDGKQGKDKDRHAHSRAFPLEEDQERQGCSQDTSGANCRKLPGKITDGG